MAEAFFVVVSGPPGSGKAGTVTHDGRPSPVAEKQDRSVIRRSFVVGETLYSLSVGGILAGDLQTLADRSLGGVRRAG